MTGRRALVIAYNFPPSGSVGTMRTVRLVERLAADQWDVTVLTATPSTYLPADPVDPSLIRRVPATVRVLTAPVIRPIAGTTRALRRIVPKRPPAGDASRVADTVTTTRRSSSPSRRLIEAIDLVTSIPDQESGWIAPAVSRGLAWGLRGRPDLLYSTGPPWSAQVVAYLLARMLRRPWVADFRDPWARGPWREDCAPALLRAWQSLESRVVHRADAIAFVTRRARAEFADYYGAALAARMHVSPNGCDADEFASLPAASTDPFVLLHAGSLYGARSPLSLIKAIGSAVGRGAIDRTRFRLRLLGVSALSPDVAALTRELGLESTIEVSPRVNRQASLEAIGSASALLLLQPGHALSVPAKAYEYLAAGRPILAITDDGETADVVREAGAGVVAPAHDVPALEAALLRVMALASSQGPKPPRNHYDGVARATELADLLSRTVQPHRVTAADPLPAPSAGGRDRA